MAKVTLVLATTVMALPAGVSFAGQRLFKLGEAAQISADTSVTFDNVADGSYTASVQSLDSNGAPMDDSVTCAVSVQTPVAPAPVPTPTTYDAPASLTVSITY